MRDNSVYSKCLGFVFVYFCFVFVLEKVVLETKAGMAVLLKKIQCLLILVSESRANFFVGTLTNLLDVFGSRVLTAVSRSLV